MLCTQTLRQKYVEHAWNPIMENKWSLAIFGSVCLWWNPGSKDGPDEGRDTDAFPREPSQTNTPWMVYKPPVIVLPLKRSRSLSPSCILRLSIWERFGWEVNRVGEVWITEADGIGNISESKRVSGRLHVNTQWGTGITRNAVTNPPLWRHALILLWIARKERTHLLRKQGGVATKIKNKPENKLFVESESPILASVLLKERRFLRSIEKSQ